MKDLPKQLDQDDLKGNLLISIRKRDAILDDIRKGNSLKKYSRKNTKLPFSVIVVDNRPYAMYSKNPLGQGGFGRVVLGQDLLTGEWFAIKVQNLKYERAKGRIRHRFARRYQDLPDEESFAHLVEDEMNLSIHKVDMENKLLQELGMLISETKRKVVKDTHSPQNDKNGYKLYSVQKLIKGKDAEQVLFHRISERLAMPEEVSIHEKFAMASSMLKDIMKLHAKRLLHCDIKPANYIWNKETKTGEYVDFGFSRYLKDGVDFFISRPRGTKDFKAPEIDRCSTYSTASDLYAIGESLRHIFFHNYTTEDILSLESKTKIYDLIRNLQRTRPEDRLNAQQALTELRNIYTEELRLEHEDNGNTTEQLVDKLKSTGENISKFRLLMLKERLEQYKQKKEVEIEEEGPHGLLKPFRINKREEIVLTQEIIDKLAVVTKKTSVDPVDLLDLLYFLSLKAVANESMYTSRYRFFEHGGLGDRIAESVSKITEDFTEKTGNTITEYNRSLKGKM